MHRILATSLFISAMATTVFADTEYRVCVRDSEALIFGFTEDGNDVVIEVIGLEDQGATFRRAKGSLLMIDLQYEAVAFGDMSMTTVGRDGAPSVAPCYGFDLGQLAGIKQLIGADLLEKNRNLIFTLAEAEREIADLQKELPHLKNQVETCNERIEARTEGLKVQLNALRRKMLSSD